MKTKAWVPAEYLDNPKAIAAYLDAVFDDGDSALISADLGKIARAMNMPQLTAQAGNTCEAVKAFIERESARRHSA